MPALDAHLSTYNSSQTSGFCRGDVVEIQGPAACGKSHMLYHIVITCILPAKHLSIDLGGWGKAAVLFDTDGSFNMSRFHRLLVSRISMLLRTRHSRDSRSESEPSDSEIEDLALPCLANLCIFRPTSSHQLAATILSLQQLHQVDTHLRTLDIGLLAVDSMSAFYWKDRFQVEQIRNTWTGGNKPSSASLTPLRHVLMALEKIRLSHAPVIVLTNWGLNPLRKPLPTGEPASPFFRQHLHPFPSPFDSVADSLPSHAANMPSTIAPPPSATYATRNASSRPHGTQTASSISQMQSRTPLHLTCHITLARHPPNAPSSSFDPLNPDKCEDPGDAGAVHGLVRIPGANDIGRFFFRINDSDILFDPPSFEGA